MSRIQISTNVSTETRRQADELIELFGYSLRDVVSIAIERMHREEVIKMAQYRKCRHCGRSFNTDLIDVDRHEASCKQHGREVVERNLNRIRRGKTPTRTGW